MKVLHINTFGNFSTGKIAADIIKLLKKTGHDGRLAFARGTVGEGIPYIKIGNMPDVITHGVMSRLTDEVGFYSKRATKELIGHIEEYDPDMIHLHNIHGYYINIEILFNYLKRSGKPVVWTLHDCWSFTGHCCHFEAVDCNKWVTGCHDCPQTDVYPRSFVDNSINNYRRKKELFTGISNMTIVSVSKWLDDLVARSYLKKYNHQQIYNGIDLSIFKPAESNFRSRYKINDKFIILGVASTWTNRKGLDDFLKLSDMLDDKYRIVLVGLNKKQTKLMKKNMIGIQRTETQKELVEIYSAADVFANPTYEDSFPTVNIEALACGTPVITYSTGGSVEAINEHCGIITNEKSPESMLRTILSGKINKLYGEDCINTAKMYDKNARYMNYIELYENIRKGRNM